MFTEAHKQAILTQFAQLPADRQNELASRINQILLANRDALDEETEALALQFKYAKIQKTGVKVD